MFLRIFILIFSLPQLINIANSSNSRLLDMEAEAYKLKIWSHHPISEDNIKENLIFLYNTKNVDQKYTSSEEFKKHYSKIMKEIDDPEFCNFALIIKAVYDGGSTDFTKMATYMLFEKVAEKYYKDSIMLKKRVKKREHSMNTEDKKCDPSVLNRFLHADGKKQGEQDD